MSNLILPENTELVLGEDPKLYTHSIFCQCVLPVRSLPKDQDLYEVTHGKSSLSIQPGYLKDMKNGNTVKQGIPSGPKARLLFTYINDQAIRTDNAVINMGSNLHQFMRNSGVPVGGKNAKELIKQSYNIAASRIYLGIWGENENSAYYHQGHVDVAKNISFWLENSPNQLGFWQPEMTLSDDYLAALQNHRVPIDFAAMVALQSNPRAMDMYVWLTYRAHSLKGPVTITYKSLHEIFGASISRIKDFRSTIRKAIKEAAPYCKNAIVEFEKDSLTISNASTTFLAASNSDSFRSDLIKIGVSESQLEMYQDEHSPETIEKALNITKENMNKGSVRNPPAFFKKALTEDWSAPADQTELKEKDLSAHLEVLDEPWKTIAIELKEKIGTPTFTSWFKEATLLVEEHDVVLNTPTNFIASYIRSNFLKDLRNICSNHIKDFNNIRVVSLSKEQEEAV